MRSADGYHLLELRYRALMWLSQSSRSLLLVVAVALGGCSPSWVNRWIAPPEVDTFARNFLESLRVGSDSTVLARLTPRLQQMEGMRDSLAAARAQFGPGAPAGVEFVGGHAFVPASDGVTRRALTYEVHVGDSWNVVSLLVLEEFEILFVDGVRVMRSPAPLRAINRLTLEGKTLAHFMAFAMFVGIATFSLIVAVLVVQTPMRRRWLWAAVALLGAGKFGFNWTTGETFIQPWSIQLFGAGLYRAGIVGPWFVLVSFPAGALIALDRRRRALSAVQAASADDVPSPAAELAAATAERDMQGSHRV